MIEAWKRGSGVRGQTEPAAMPSSLGANDTVRRNALLAERSEASKALRR